MELFLLFFIFLGHAVIKFKNNKCFANSQTSIYHGMQIMGYSSDAGKVYMNDGG